MTRTSTRAYRQFHSDQQIFYWVIKRLDMERDKGPIPITPNEMRKNRFA